MMGIEYTTGDLLRDDSEALVNTVNCVGFMGRGIALQFRKAWPQNFRAYEAACRRDEVRPGRMFVFETGLLTPPRFLINFPTKRHWRAKSRIEVIDAGLEALVEEIRLRGIRSIALPPLGAGLGGLPWPQVRGRIEAALAGLEQVRIRVYEPTGAPDAASMVHVRKVPRMTSGRAALVALMDRYLAGLLDPMITLLEVHKLMYFLQEAGEPLRLQYTKDAYGPYAPELRHVLHAIEGHLVSGYADGGDRPDKPLALVPGAIADAQAFLVGQPETRDRMDRVFRLVDGFESAFGLELLATVHWILRHESSGELPDVIHHTHAWNPRKLRFTERQIGIAVDVLRSQGFAPQPTSTA